MITEYLSSLSRLFANAAFPKDAFYIHKAFQGRKIIVYGAGESFHYFKEVVMRRYGYMPSLVLDRKFGQGDTFEGIPAYSPLAYHPPAEERENGLVVVCLGKQHSFDQAVRGLREMGFVHIISLRDIYEIHNPFGLPQELVDKGFQYYITKENKSGPVCRFGQMTTAEKSSPDARRHIWRESRFPFPCVKEANSTPLRESGYPKAIRVSSTAV